MNRHDAIMARFECRRYDVRTSDADLLVLINEFEDLIGAALPNDYREFLTHFGDCALHMRVFFNSIEANPWGRQCIDGFFGFPAPNEDGSPHPSDLRFQWDVFTNCGQNKLVPIANVIGGDSICISLAESEGVFFYDRDHLELGEEGLAKMVALLNQKGIDPDKLNLDDIVCEAEKIAPGSRNKPPGSGNLYLVARTFDEFLEALEPRTEDD